VAFFLVKGKKSLPRDGGSWRSEGEKGRYLPQIRPHQKKRSVVLIRKLLVLTKKELSTGGRRKTASSRKPGERRLSPASPSKRAERGEEVTASYKFKKVQVLVEPLPTTDAQKGRREKRGTNDQKKLLKRGGREGTPTP